MREGRNRRRGKGLALGPKGKSAERGISDHGIENFDLDIIEYYALWWLGLGEGVGVVEPTVVLTGMRITVGRLPQSRSSYRRHSRHDIS